MVGGPGFGGFDDISGFEPEPEEAASEGVVTVAEAFFTALKGGDARALWDLFSETARAFIINIGHERGMEFDLASQIRAGTAADDEMDGFLSDLMAGLRHDLAGVDLNRVALEAKAEPEAPMQMRVNYLVPLGPEIAGLQTAIPAGSLLLSLGDDGWKVERLIPRPGGPAPRAS